MSIFDPQPTYVLGTAITREDDFTKIHPQGYVQIMESSTEGKVAVYVGSDLDSTLAVVRLTTESARDLIAVIQDAIARAEGRS